MTNALIPTLPRLASDLVTATVETVKQEVPVSLGFSFAFPWGHWTVSFTYFLLHIFLGKIPIRIMWAIFYLCCLPIELQDFYILWKYSLTMCNSFGRLSLTHDSVLWCTKLLFYLYLTYFPTVIWFWYHTEESTGLDIHLRALQFSHINVLYF